MSVRGARTAATGLRCARQRKSRTEGSGCWMWNYWVRVRCLTPSHTPHCGCLFPAALPCLCSFLEEDAWGSLGLVGSVHAGA